MLYWEETKNGKKVVTHATIINSVTKNDILFAGHSNPAYDESLKEKMIGLGQSVKIVRLKDYLPHKDVYGG